MKYFPSLTLQIKQWTKNSIKILQTQFVTVIIAITQHILIDCSEFMNMLKLILVLFCLLLFHYYNKQIENT